MPKIYFIIIIYIKLIMIKEKIKTIGKYNFKKEEYFPVFIFFNV